MFCSNCGNAIAEDTNFCGQCGKAVRQDAPVVSTDGSVDKEALKRKINRLIDTFNPYPDLSMAYTPQYSNEFEYNQVNDYNPFYRLNQLKGNITDCILQTTAYKYDVSEFDDVVNDTYGRRLKAMKEQIRDYVFSEFENSTKNMRCTYNDLPTLRRDEFTIYFFARVATTICCDIQDANGLITTRIKLMRLNSFFCEKNNGLHPIYNSGHVLSLPQFATEKQLYDHLMNFLKEAALQMNPALQEYFDKETAVTTKHEKKRKTRSAINILTRTIMAILSPLYMYLSYQTAAAMGADFSQIPRDITLLVAMILCIILIIFNVKIKSVPVVIVADIIISALLYPVSLVAVVAIQIVVVGFVILVIGFISIFHSDRTNII